MPVEILLEQEKVPSHGACPSSSSLSLDTNTQTHRFFRWTSHVLGKGWAAMRLGTWGILELLYPSYCAACLVPLPIGTEGCLLCIGCRLGNWPLAEIPVCSRCCAPLDEEILGATSQEGACRKVILRASDVVSAEMSDYRSRWSSQEEVEISLDGACPSCRGEGIGLARAWACFAYAGSVRALLQQWKYQGDAFAGEALCALFREEACGLASQIGMYDWLIPVPLSRKRLHQRGFHQAWELTKSLAPFAKGQMLPEILQRHETTSQVGLSGAERRSALLGQVFLAPWVKERLRGARILLIDDVITTGATLGTCADILRQAGAVRVDALSLCRAI
ncbi:MAG: ComF family protein [Myxococcales bacterium]|nr:ComF family protein [Myxococcales bacterium]